MEPMGKFNPPMIDKSNPRHKAINTYNRMKNMRRRLKPSVMPIRNRPTVSGEKRRRIRG